MAGDGTWEAPEGFEGGDKGIPDKIGGRKSPPFAKSNDLDCQTAPVVRIIGAGITGLTIAHELVMRGFSVQVIEPERDTLEVNGTHVQETAVGGVAKTQNANWNAYGIQDCVGTFNQAVAEIEPLPPLPLVWVPGPLPADPDNVELDLPPPPVPINDFFMVALKEAYIALGSLPLKLRVRIAVQSGRDFDTDFNDAIGIKSDLIAYFTGQGLVGGAPHLWLGTNAIEYELLVPPTEFLEAAANAALAAGDPIPEFFGFVIVDVVTLQLPGEHGYRFFPSFYVHTFDTMRRTPLYDAYTGDALHRTVYDNLNPTTHMGLGLNDHRDPMVFQRRRPGSLTEAKELHDEMCDRLDFTDEDMVRYQLKMFKWLTSCTDRRAAYGALRFRVNSFGAVVAVKNSGTWWDYILGDQPETWSSGFRKQLAASSQALVAMAFDEIDAHTYGNVSTQLMLDQMGNGERTDMTLNAPTTDAWLAPWKSYLKRLGVRFYLGELVDFTYDATSGELLPVWGDQTSCKRRSNRQTSLPISWPDHVPVPEDPDDEIGFEHFDSLDEYGNLQEIGLPTYNVLAIPLERIWHLLRFAPGGVQVAIQDLAAWSLWAILMDYLVGGFIAWGLDMTALQLERSVEDYPLGSARRQMAEARARIARERATAAEVNSSIEAAKARHQRAFPWLQAWLDRADSEHPDPEYNLYGPFKEGPFRSMNGVQYYLETDWSLHDGHMYFPDAPWGVSAISQRQFWLELGVSGIVSVDLCDFHKEIDVNGNMVDAWSASPLELAQGSWAQVLEGLAAPVDHAGNPMPWYPDPIWFHIDDFLEYDGAAGITRNCAPFLINRPGEWNARPGSTRSHRDSTIQQIAPGKAVDAENRDGRRASTLMWYPVDFGRWLIGGPHMKTFTRMTTMEAANESGRHVANRIIHHLLYEHSAASLPPAAQEQPGNWGAGQRCGPFARIWNMENDEIPDLVTLKEIDRLLIDHGYPHLVEILKVEETLDHFLGVDDPEHATHAMARAIQTVTNRESKEMRRMLRRVVPGGVGAIMHTLRDFLQGLGGAD